MESERADLIGRVKVNGAKRGCRVRTRGKTGRLEEVRDWGLLGTCEVVACDEKQRGLTGGNGVPEANHVECQSMPEWREPRVGLMYDTS